MKLLTVTQTDGNTVDIPEAAIILIRQVEGDRYRLLVAGAKNPIEIGPAERAKLLGKPLKKAPTKKPEGKKPADKKKK